MYCIIEEWMPKHFRFQFIKRSAVSDQAGIYLLKVNNRNTRTRCEICSKITIVTYFTPCSSASIVNFEHVIAGRGVLLECCTKFLRL